MSGRFSVPLPGLAQVGPDTTAAVEPGAASEPLGDFLASANEVMRRLLALPEQASTIAPEIDALHYFVFAVMTSLAVGASLLAVFFAFRYGRREDADASGRPRATPRIVAPLWLEGIFAAGLLGIFVFWWYIAYQQYLEMSRPPDSALEVYVTAKQWMWKFDYPEGRGSVGVLYVPEGQPIKLILSSRDVIHSFFVPAFRIKQDVVPGRYTTAWFEATGPGAFDVFCAEFCGTDHSRMLARVVVLPPARFEAWRRAEPPSAESDAAAGPDDFDAAAAPMAVRGRLIALEHGCFNCHTDDGEPHIGPSWLGSYGSIRTMANGEQVRVDEGYITESMMDPEARIVEGFAPVMPSYQGLIDPAGVAAIVEYIRSLRHPETAAGPRGEGR